MDRLVYSVLAIYNLAHMMHNVYLLHFYYLHYSVNGLLLELYDKQPPYQYVA